MRDWHGGYKGKDVPRSEIKPPPLSAQSPKSIDREIMQIVEDMSMDEVLEKARACKERRNVATEFRIRAVNEINYHFYMREALSRLTGFTREDVLEKLVENQINDTL